MREDHGKDGPGPGASSSQSSTDDALADLSALATPLYAGRYELQELLGVGASGSVYRVRDVELDEFLALKVLRKELVGDKQTIALFRNEVRLARRVTSRNVARVYDIGEYEGEKYLTMELIEGESLTRRMTSTVDGTRRPLPLLEIAELIEQVCAGLLAAHQSGVVHCDLKPDNLLIAKDGRVVITDFGIARALQQSAPAKRDPRRFDGTPMYVAPEQVGGEHIDARADLYSLGAVIYELLTGKPPFSGDSLLAILAARVLSPPPDPRQVRPELPAAVAEIVLRCLAVHPKERFQSASELATALRQAVTSAANEPTLKRSGRSRQSDREADGQTAGKEPAAAHSQVRQSDVGRAAETPNVDSVQGYESAPESTPLTVNASRTVAVIPLLNQAGADDEYLVYGVTQELIDRLGTLRTLRVFGHSTTASPQFRNKEPLAIAKELGAALVLTGSLSRSGDRLRLTVSVVSTKERSPLFSDQIDCSPASALSACDTLVAAIARALRIGPTGQDGQDGRNDRKEPPSGVPAESDTVELYLRARYLYGRSDEASLTRSVGLFERVIARAPADPTLRMSYALALSRLWFYGDPGAAEKALPAAEAVVAQLPLHGESYLALAGVRFQGADLLGAVQALAKALALSPDLADAHELLGRILVETGPIRDGLMRLIRARSLDPGLFRTLAEQARTHALLGDFERAHKLLADPALDSGSFAIQWILRGRLCLWNRDRKRAEEYLSHPEITQGKYPRAKLLLQVAAGLQQIDPKEALSAGLASDRSSPRGHTFLFQMHAELQSAYGQYEQAVRSVARSVDAGLADLTWIERCPLLLPMASDPRMSALRRIVYARAYAIREALRAVPPVLTQ